MKISQQNKRFIDGWLKRMLTPLVFLISITYLQAATKTSTGTGNWSSSSMWSPSGVPANTDNVVIRSGDVITVNGSYTCNNLDIGNITNSNATVQITSSAKSLTINGDLTINAGNKGKTYTLDAGPGTINIAGTITYAGTSGTDIIQVGSGTVNITPALNINAAAYKVTCTGAGTINFYSDFTDAQGSLTPYAGCNIYFYRNYTVSSSTTTWGGNGTAHFGNGSSITCNNNVTFNDFDILPSANVTMIYAAGNVAVGGSVILGSGSTFDCNENITVSGDWTNNGGTFSNPSKTITFDGSSGIIGGTGTTAFNNLTIGASNINVAYTMNNNNSCNYLVLSAAGSTRTLTLGSSSVVFTVNNDITINQATANSKTNLLAVNAGTCNVSGNLIFSGSNATTSRIVQVAVTTGSFALTGNVTWLSNSVSSTEIISVTSGTLTFASSLTMGSGSGTLAVTGTGIVNFNGSSAPSFTFGGATAPVLTTTNGCTLNFANGFTNNSTALTLAATSQTNFSGTGTITPTAAITFGNLAFTGAYNGTIATGGAVQIAGNVTIASGATFILNQNLEVDGDWMNNGGMLSAGANTITFNGASNTISGTGSTSFPNVSIGKSGAGANTVSYTMSSSNSMSSLSFDGNTLSRTLTLGAGKTLIISGNVTINQPTAASYSTILDVNAGTCLISGNLLYVGTSTTGTKIGEVNVGSGTFTLNGTITWMSASTSAVSVLSVSTGVVNLNSSLTMGSGSGTINITGAATVNFNGATAPSLAFGGTTAPVFNISSDASINFVNGLTVTTTPLTFSSGSLVTSGSLVSPAAVTIVGSNTLTNNGSLTIYGDLVGTTSGSAFVNGASSTVSITGNVMSTGTFNVSATNNTVSYNGSTDQTIKLPVSNYYNLLFANSGTKTLAGSIAAKSVTLSSGTLSDAGYTLTINGSAGFTNNGGTYSSTGTLAFIGSSASQIGGTVATTFNNITMNNSGGVILNAPTTIDGALTLSNGIITSTSTNYLKLTATATASAGSASTYVDGPMIKIGNTDFTFPTGNGGRWRRVGVSGMTSATTQITAQYFYAAPPSTSLFNSTLTEVGNNEYWDVSRTITSDPIKIRLYWETQPLTSLATDCSTLTVAHFKGGIWQQESSTMQSGLLSCLLGSSGSIETDWVSTFSPFGFGGSGGGSLPIKLVSFDAVANGNIVETNWVTRLEINNAYFTLERSSDAENWQEVAQVQGAGNSTSILRYQQDDLNPIGGTSYYRLKQTDFDGQFTYSDMVQVHLNGAKNSISVFPNPTSDVLNIHATNSSNEIKVEIFDLSGRKMFAQNYAAINESGTNSFTIPIKNVLPSGMYLLSALTNGIEYRERIIVN